MTTIFMIASFMLDWGISNLLVVLARSSHPSSLDASKQRRVMADSKAVGMIGDFLRRQRDHGSFSQ
jgi:hypothetical protein